MFIETLKNIVITLVTVLIFISAVELISPNNKMQKYIKFILGLILISTILNPILQFISNGEKSVADGIEGYEQVFSKSKDKIDLDNINSSKEIESKGDNRKKAFVSNFNKNCDKLLVNQFKTKKFKSDVDCDINFTNITLTVNKLKENEDNGQNRKKAFVSNFNKNCDNTLKSQFKNMIFKSEVDCDVKFTDLTFNIKKLKIGVDENKINKIKKIVVNSKTQNDTKEENKEYTEIIDFVSSELNIPKEKIEVYEAQSKK